MTWKQPIPTNLETIFGGDYRSQLLFRELIYRSANKDGHFTDKRGKTTPVKRGQVVFGRNQFATYLSWCPKTCERILQKLEKTYMQVTLQPNKNCTVVTILFYDELTDMSQQVSKQCPSSVQAVSTSKSVKSVKNVKSNHISTDTRANADTFLANFNKLRGSKFRTVEPFLKNFNYWQKHYSVDEMSRAVFNAQYHPFWSSKLTPERLLRQANAGGETDIIGELLSITHENAA